MDVEKTIEFILETQARGEARFEAWQAKFEEELNRSAAENKAAHQAFEVRHKRTEDFLRRAIRAGVREARAERKRRQELDDKMTQLAAAQLLTEEKMRELGDRVDRFLKGLSGENGKQNGG